MHHNVVSFLVEDYANALANLPLMDRYLRPAAIALAEQFETDLWGLVPSLTLGPIGTGGSPIDAALLRQAKATLDQAKAPVSDRSVIVSPADMQALLGSSELTNYFAFSQAQSIREGAISQIYGFSTFLSQIAPLTMGTQLGVALHQNALIYATRLFAPIPQGAGVSVAQVGDDESGLSLRVAMQWDPSNIGLRCNVDLLYGIQVLRAGQAVVLNS